MCMDKELSHVCVYCFAAEKLPSHLIYIDDKKGEISKLNPSQEVLTQMDNIYRKTAMTNYKLKIEQEMKLSNKGRMF